MKKIDFEDVFNQIRELELPVYKDPRFLVHSRIIDYWAGTRDDIKIIYLNRNPHDIVKSVYKIPEWNTPVFRTDVDMIQKKEREFLEAVSALDIPILRYEFPYFLNMHEIVITQLNRWIELPDNAADIWMELKDDNEH